eukprot:TRINITY_DN2420_c0_g2_i1.p1 TRINITY_DN2420_c0_g2~~TRINITY_DN2420_c0_g2_i1.p1  ORF type:complete len:108 (-),score=9.42 TRINITY_DN2420_c0_g2_i1:173-496(-)
MVFFTQPVCGACKTLKSQIYSHPIFLELTKSFIMVNVEDAHEEPGGNWQPDGAYVPRVFFITPEGEVDYSIQSNSRFKYYFSSPWQLIEAMKRFLAKLPTHKNKIEL